MHVLLVMGARPNFIKMAPLDRALRKQGHKVCLVHTGQHHDDKMSGIFFRTLGMPKVDYNLEVFGGSHAEQTAQIMMRFEPVLQSVAPDLVVVAGDVNSSLACALVAAKMGVLLGHLEAGLRSYDRKMPEELNRILIDHMSDILLTPSQDADAHLEQEGISKTKIYRVGNVMIDTLMQHQKEAEAKSPLAALGLQPKKYILLTLHRAELIDDPKLLEALVVALLAVDQEIAWVWPMHPRTRAKLHTPCLQQLKSIVEERMLCLEPQGYLEFLSLQTHARVVLTDSGGVQEETTALKTPCLTLRNNTERPITVSCGSNRLVGCMPQKAAKALSETLLQTKSAQDLRHQTACPPLWDGQTAPRVVDALQKCISGQKTDVG